MASISRARRLADPELFAHHLDRLHRAARMMCRSPHDAEDLVQETLARVLTRPRRVGRGSELAYLLGALRNTHLNTLRTWRRRPRTVELPADEAEALRSRAADPEPALERRELLAAVAGLPADFRNALVLVDLVGLSYREAAGHLKVPEGTITTRLFRARRALSATTGIGDPREGSGGRGVT